MSASQNGIVKTLPVAFVLLIIGGALGFLGFEGQIALASITGIFFGLLGALLGVMVQLASKPSESAGPSEQLAKDIGAAVEKGFGGLAESLEKSTSELTAVSGKLESGFSESAKALQDGLGSGTADLLKQFNESTKALQQGLGSSTGDVAKEFGSSAEALTKALSEHRDAVAKSADDLSKNIVDSYATGAETFRQALTKHVEEINSTSVDWHEEYRKVLSDYSAQLNETTEKLTQKLAEVAHIAGNIDEVLNVNKAMNEALETISSAQEFKESMVSFKNHLEKSDKLLEEVSKPRRIQLVEAEVDDD